MEADEVKPALNPATKCESGANEDLTWLIPTAVTAHRDVRP
jgi:hypothetical protein